MICNSLDSLGGTARWVPHDRNPADCLTKLRGNADSVLKMLREGSYQVVEESEEMAQRKIYRERTGRKNPRTNNATSTHGSSYAVIPGGSSFKYVSDGVTQTPISVYSPSNTEFFDIGKCFIHTLSTFKLFSTSPVRSVAPCSDAQQSCQ